MTSERSERIEIPVLPLRDVVVYPHMVIPLFVGREKSIRCLEAAMDQDKKIMLVAQKEASTDEPGVNDLFTVGTVASILQMLKLPDGTVKVLVEGLQRARISALSDDGEYFSAKAEYLESPALDEREQEVLVRTAIGQFEGYIKLNKKIPPEVLTSLNSIDDPARLADTIAAHMPLKLADKQSVLEMSDVNERLEYLMAMMESEIDPGFANGAPADALVRRTRATVAGEHVERRRYRARIDPVSLRRSAASHGAENGEQVFFFFFFLEFVL